VAGLTMPDPVAAAPGLAAVLSTITDPRKRRGVRHGLVTLLSVAVCAVAAGARSLVAIAEWAADLPVEVAAALGINAAAPSESAVRRLVQRLDPDRRGRDRQRSVQAIPQHRSERRPDRVQHLVQ
jgi:hypothetical protein